MKEVFLEKQFINEKAQTELSETDRKRLSRWRVTLYFSFITGIVSTVAGLILGAVSYTGFFRNARAANLTGNLMIVAAFPLMMLGAHALDKIGEIKRHSTNMPHHWKD